MHTRTLIATALLGWSLSACSPSDGGSRIDTVDAPKAIDAAIDTPPANLSGLGQKCGQGMPACPANASECVGLQGTASFCTPKCASGATGMTNASGQLTTTTPPPNNQTCSSAYTGTVGMPVCGVILTVVPADNPLVANKAYSGIDLGCVITCGTGGACPASTTCNTTVGACFPN
jgi:hypothetical protein